jgi:DNA-binding XRE family transcriptional regulator
LKLFQRSRAKSGVDKTSIYNWETNRTKPGLEHMRAIIRFLGFNPMPPSDGWPERLVQHRTALGLSQKEAAHQMGVDPCTLARRERGEREPAGAFAAHASRFLTAVGDLAARQNCIMDGPVCGADFLTSNPANCGQTKGCATNFRVADDHGKRLSLRWALQPK